LRYHGSMNESASAPAKISGRLRDKEHHGTI